MHRLTLLFSQGGVVVLGKKVSRFSCHTGIKGEASDVQGASANFLKKGMRLSKY